MPTITEKGVMKMKFNIKFVQNKKIYFIISSVVIIIGLISMIFRGFYWDVDFAGGTEITYSIATEGFSAADEAAVIEAQAREALTKIGSDSDKIKIAQSSGEEVIIKSLELNEYEIAAIHAQLKEYYNDPVTAGFTVDELAEALKELENADTETDNENSGNIDSDVNNDAGTETETDGESDNENTDAGNDSDAVNNETNNAADTADTDTDTDTDADTDTGAADADTNNDGENEADAADTSTNADAGDAESDAENTVPDSSSDTDTDADTDISTENELVKRVGLESVSGSVSADLRNSAIISAVVAVLLMLLYITIRFQFSSALAAVVCLCHDVFVVLAAYSILQIPVSSSVIAVALTILGYSINATIIVFDRVRENVKIVRNATFDEKVNLSINQTLMRSVNTTVTTLLTIGLIYILGVQSIKEFALPLIVGIVAGLYSSVCLAGSLWTIFKGKNEKVK